MRRRPRIPHLHSWVLFAAFSLALAGAWRRVGAAATEGPKMKETVRSRLWLWGHHAGLRRQTPPYAWASATS